MAKIDYKRIWKQLKEEHIEEYIMLQRFIKQYPNIMDYKIKARSLSDELHTMDMLDGTQEFNNLLHDLKQTEEDK